MTAGQTADMALEDAPGEMIVGIAADGTRFPVEKLDAHRRNQHHEAISVFVFSDRSLLLQRRASDKYHSGGLWANTCCSHPRWGEEPDACARRRLMEETGIDMPLLALGEIRYAATVGDLFENEHVHCFAGAAPDPLDLTRADPAETAELVWRDLEEVAADLEARPELYAPWFAIYLREHRHLLERAAALCAAART